MNELLDIANQITTKSGLTTAANGDHIDIKIFNDVLGALSRNADGALMYSSADGFETCGTSEELRDVILNDLNNQFEFTQVSPEDFKHVINEVGYSPLKKALSESFQIYMHK